MGRLEVLLSRYFMGLQGNFPGVCNERFSPFLLHRCLAIFYFIYLLYDFQNGATFNRVTMATFFLHGVHLVYARRWPWQPLSCMVYTSCMPGGDHGNHCLAWCTPGVRQAVTMPTFLLHGVHLVYARWWPCQLCLAWCTPRVRLGYHQCVNTLSYTSIREMLT